jgi:excisionase family DNA binding protein
MINIEDNLLTTHSAANYLGISKTTIYRMVNKQILSPIKTPGGQRRFDITELDKYKEKSKVIKAPQNPSSISIDNSDKEKLSENNDDNVNEEDNGKVDPRNKINDLTGKAWLPETKSFWFQKGLGSKHPHAKIEKQHPAPFSFQDVARLISFFTKKNEKVLDPFSGVGSTLKACSIFERKGLGIELSDHWNCLAKERLETEVGEDKSKNQTIITGDSRTVLKEIPANSFDFMVTSPPYWSILNKKADHKVKNERVKNNLATNYSNYNNDLGNIENYEEFLNILTNDIFMECARILKPNKYMSIIVSDFRNKSDFISFHSDLITKLQNKNIDENHILKLQGVKVLAQNHKSLLPYGYPFAYVENIHHQYILILKKMIRKKT